MKKSSKKWLTCDFDGNIPENLNETEKIESVKNVSSFKISFQTQIVPKFVQDLAVHPKKINEVETWLENNAGKAENKFLLISGPTGCGKTSTIVTLCKKLSITLLEWINPVDQDFKFYQYSNQLTKFIDFLIESKWNSLFSSDSSKKVILIEDFPNIIIRNPEEIKSILQECSYKARYPIIFICTDSNNKGLNLSQSLFPPEIKNLYKITHISFNACAASLMKNALKRAANLIQNESKTLPSESIDKIIESSMGDIRCAINQFYFATLLGVDNFSNKQIKDNKKRKRSVNVKLAPSSVASLKDENLGLFHGLGRILNPKRIQLDKSWRFVHDINKIVDEFAIQPETYTAFLFENYLKYFGNFKNAAQAADILSFSQIFLVKWTAGGQDTLIFALWVSVLGLMVFNEHKVSKWNQITAPVKLKKSVNQDFISSETKNLTVMDYFYYNIIKNKPKMFMV